MGKIFLNLKKYYNNFLLNNDKIKVVSFLKIQYYQQWILEL